MFSSLLRILVASSLLCFSMLVCYSQPPRIAVYNTIGWYTYNGDHKISQKWEIHTEYHGRRIDLVRTWQQSLARLGATCRLADQVKIGGGYTYFVTYPFGDYPQADKGVPYPEHRFYEDVQLKSAYGQLGLTHRFRFEQRWLGQLNDTEPHSVTGWKFQHRVRYQISGNLPLKGKTIDKGELYANFFDELFISYGRKVSANIFNQNRISAGLGYRIKTTFL